MKVYPFDEVAINALKKMTEGWTIFQQFNCAKCGTKQTIEVPNQFFTKGECEECKHVSDLVKDGCNFAAIWSNFELPTPKGKGKSE